MATYLFGDYPGLYETQERKERGKEKKQEGEEEVS